VSARGITHTAKDARRRELARIHLLAKALGMDTSDPNPNSDYRSILWATARVHSAGDLDAAGRARVIEHMELCMPAAARSRAYRRRPRNLGSQERGPQLKKIEALLASAGRPWAYAHAMAKRMFGVDDVAFCAPDQLRRVIAALAYDAKRHGRRA
jgi:hypothetical protein